MCHFSVVVVLFVKQEGEGYIHYVYIGLKSLSKESQENGKKWLHLDQGTRGSGKEGDFLKNILFYRTVLDLHKHWGNSTEKFSYPELSVSPVISILD